MLDINEIRRQFPILKTKVHGSKDLVYLDNAATTQKPQTVIDSLCGYYTGLNSNVHRGVHYLSSAATEAFELSRQKVRSFINAPSTQNIVFTRGTTESLNLLADSLSFTFLDQDSEVIITQMEHHSNIVPWHLAQQKYGFKLKYIPLDDKGELRIRDLENLLTPRTKVLSMAHISNTLGTINPIKDIIEICHRNKTMVIIDGAQSIAHLKIDVQDLDCDFFCFSGHKVYAPMGIGVMYAKAEHLEKMYPYHGGGEMIKDVTMLQTTFNDIPYKFEAGTPSVADTIALGVALDFVQDVGFDDIIAHEDALLDYATKELTGIEGLRIFGQSQHKSSCISFLVEGIHHLDLGTILDMQGIAIRTGHHCAQPVMQHFGIEGTDRVSFAMYNTFEEVDIFIQSLKKAISMLR